MQQILYAAGFNAWGQLQFDTPGNQVGTQAEPDDITAFTCVLEDPEIVHVRPSLSFTTVTTSHGILTAGVAPVGDDGGAEGGQYFSEALNGRVVVFDKAAGSILQYASVDDFMSAAHSTTAAACATVPCTRFAGFPGVMQIVAYDVGFAALTADGQVWTWGDGRFPACLGRDVDVPAADRPADRPGRVTALDDLPTGPIVKLAAGGHVLAALTRGRDLYCWGGYSGRKSDMLLEGLTGEPAPVVVEVGGNDDDDDDSGDDKIFDTDIDTDIVDVGVGEAHMIVLTAGGSVCVLGSNANGQLGLGLASEDDTGNNDGPPPQAPASEAKSSWVKIKSLPAGKGQRITGVYAGPRSSFVVVSE